MPAGSDDLLDNLHKCKQWVNVNFQVYDVLSKQYIEIVIIMCMGRKQANVCQSLTNVINGTVGMH